MKKKQHQISNVILLATAWGLVSAPRLQAIDGFWVTDAPGNWNDAVNWTNTVAAPNGIGDIARLTAPLTANRIIALANDVTLGQLEIENDEYDIGATTVATPELIFDNAGAPASLKIVNRNLALPKPTDFRHPIRVVDHLLFEAVDSGNAALTLYSGFKGDADAVLDFTYQLSSGQNMIELRSNLGYAGTVNLRRQGTVSQSLGIRFYNADAIFAGGAGSIRVYPGVTLNFRAALTDAQAARFTYAGIGQSVVLDSSGTFKDLASPETRVPHGGLLYLIHSSSTVIPRYATGAAMPLNNTTLRLTGYNTSPGQTNEDFPGTLSLSGGNRIWIENRAHANSIAGLHFSGFTRSENGTLTLSGTGGGSPLGATVSNRVTVASGLPVETNGILPPYLIYYEQNQTVNGMFTYDGPNGLTIFDAYQATNDFSLGASAVVTQTDSIDLGGGDASCYALRSRNAIQNGDLTIVSGGLILGSAFKNHTANLFFGENGSENAYIHMDGHPDAAKNIELGGVIHCQDFVKFGAKTDLRLTASNAIAGKVELQEGGLVAAHQYALGSGVDLEMGIGTLFDLKPGSVGCDIGGLRSLGRATVRPNGTAAEHLVIHPAANTTNIFNGSLSNASGTLSVTVAGTGRQIFNGTSDYTGNTVVQTGATLLLGEDGVLGATITSVSDGGIFGGIGSTGGALVLDDGATLKLTPGNPLQVGSLDASDPATVTIDISENAAFIEGIVLTWSGDSPASAPDFVLVGAPVAPHGAYGAVYDGDTKQITVTLTFPPPSVIIIK